MSTIAISVPEGRDEGKVRDLIIRALHGGFLDVCREALEFAAAHLDTRQQA